MQNIKIIVIVNINRRLAMIDISKTPKLSWGGAPIPTKKVLKKIIFLLVYYPQLKIKYNLPISIVGFCIKFIVGLSE